jgi:hypothetical protein
MVEEDELDASLKLVYNVGVIASNSEDGLDFMYKYCTGQAREGQLVEMYESAVVVSGVKKSLVFWDLTKTVDL